MAEFYYKLAANNPRNPLNTADKFEQNLIRNFKSGGQKEYSEVVELNGKEYLYYALPFLVNKPSCMRCHGTPDAAPQELVRRYGDTAGFYEKLGDMRAIISIRVPLESEMAEARRTFFIHGATTFFVLILFFVLGGTRLLAYFTKHSERLIKKRFESETLFRGTFEQAAVGIAHLSPDGKCLRVNQKFCEITGYDNDEILNLSLADITSSEDTDVDKEMSLQLLNGDIATYSTEKRYIRKNKETVWVNETNSLSRDDQGKPDFTISVIQDITQRRQLKAEVDKALIQAEEANSKLSDAMNALWGEMELAKKIQTVLLPENTKNIHPDFEIAATMFPAEHVGGDFYDFNFDKSGALWFAIGDVSGHGITPGLIMMMAQTIHSTVTANFDTDARSLVVRVNEILYMNVSERLHENHFMTFTALKYLGRGQFQHAGAHLSMLVYRQKTGACELVRTRGVYLNFKKDISKATKNAEFSLEPGDILILYTDGLTEAENPDGKMLDIDGFMRIVEKHAHQEPEAMKEMIMADVVRWCDNRREDDMTLVIIKRVTEH